MANLGRAYPRAFARDFSFYRDQRFLDYLPRRMVASFSGTTWAISGWPSGEMVSGEAIADYDSGRLRWTWATPPGANPVSYLYCEWILTGQLNWWRAYWEWRYNAVQWFYNDLTVYGSNPSNFPRVLGGPWKDRFNADTFAIGIVSQRIGNWGDEP